MSRFQKSDQGDGRFKIKDTDNDKWVGDGNGRRIRMDDEERIDNITDILNKRVGESE